jgi:hypothetical protein
MKADQLDLKNSSACWSQKAIWKRAQRRMALTCMLLDCSMEATRANNLNSDKVLAAC